MTARDLVERLRPIFCVGYDAFYAADADTTPDELAVRREAASLSERGPFVFQWFPEARMRVAERIVEEWSASR